jgi:hypothetical protein
MWLQNVVEIVGSGETAATEVSSAVWDKMGLFNGTPESACPFEGEPVQAAKDLKMLSGGMPNCRPTGIACSPALYYT